MGATTIVFLCLITLTMSENSVNRLNFGLLFRPVGEMNIISDKWLHIFRLQLPKLPTHKIPGRIVCHHLSNNLPNDQNIHGLCATSAHAGQKLPTVCRHDSYNYLRLSVCKARSAYTEVVKDIYGDLSSEYIDFLNLIQQVIQDSGLRHKCAWLDISGVFSTVFGFGRQKDIDQMKAAVKMLHNDFKEHTLEESNLFKEMHTAIDMTKTRLNHLSSNLFQLANFTQQFTQSIHHQLMYQIEFSSVRFHDIFTLYREAVQTSNELKEVKDGLLQLLQGWLSPHLIHPRIARDMLDNIAHRLHSSNHDFKVALESPSDFYHLNEFYVQRHQNILYLGVYVPLAYKDAKFNLFQIDSYPLPAASNIDHVTYIRQPKMFLAHSDDHSFYFHPTEEDLLVHCTSGHNRMCLYQPSLRNGNQDFTCEYTIFTNSEHITKNTCKYSISSDIMEPKIVALNESSFLILNVTEYTVQCENLHEIKKGCVACVLTLQHNCGCTLRYHSTTISLSTKNVRAR